jgi:hypothetical protein
VAVGVGVLIDVAVGLEVPGAGVLAVIVDVGVEATGVLVCCGGAGVVDPPAGTVEGVGTA